MSGHCDDVMTITSLLDTIDHSLYLRLLQDCHNAPPWLDQGRDRQTCLKREELIILLALDYDIISDTEL